MLVVFSGRPGTGKTTLAKALATLRSATYVRIDVIEHALIRDLGQDREIGDVGYGVAFAIAYSNLELGRLVVADSVNPVAESRQGWRNAALHAGVGLLEVEVVCSDEAEHRRRVETRIADIAGFVLPSWASVKAHDYEAWTEPRLVVDTASISPDAAVATIAARLDAMLAERALPS